MSNSLRYRQTHICDHLASQYVMGLMTPKARKRMEALRMKTPELERAITFWSEEFAQIDHALPEAPLNPNAWKAIDKHITRTPSHPSTQSTIWQQLLFWKIGSAAGLLSSLVLAFMLLFPPVSNELTTGPDYLAAMQPHGQDNNTIHFVVSAYKKDKNNPSRLFIQWSQQQSNSHTALHLWAEDKNSGEMQYIGIAPPSDTPWHLNKTQWDAITNSARLLTTDSSLMPNAQNTLFSGLCIQMKPWHKQRAI